jgi:broad specificity phosphatase PhoE
MRADAVSEYEDAYDRASIRDDDMPPAALRELASSAALVVASDMPRALRSAQMLAGDRTVVVSELLREIRLEPPRWIPFRLPIEVWDAMSHLQWSARLLIGATSDFTRRANTTAEWLAEQAAPGTTVLAVTHGGFRRIVSDALVGRGWRVARGSRGYGNWSVWSLSR